MAAKGIARCCRAERSSGPATADPWRSPSQQRRDGTSSSPSDPSFELTCLPVSRFLPLCVRTASLSWTPNCRSELNFALSDSSASSTVLPSFECLGRNSHTAKMSTAPQEALDFKSQGNAAIKSHSWPEAIDFYTKAIEIYDQDSTFFCNRAQVSIPVLVSVISHF